MLDSGSDNEYWTSTVTSKIVVALPGTLLDSVLDIGNPNIEEDRHRLRAFRYSGEAIPLHQVKAWVESWGTDNELPRPEPQRIG